MRQLGPLAVRVTFGIAIVGGVLIRLVNALQGFGLRVQVPAVDLEDLRVCVEEVEASRVVLVELSRACFEDGAGLGWEESGVDGSWFCKRTGGLGTEPDVQ